MANGSDNNRAILEIHPVDFVKTTLLSTYIDSKHETSSRSSRLPDEALANSSYENAS